MKIKVSKASGPVLDWMVAKCEGIAVHYQPGFLTYSEIQVLADWDDALEYTPSTDWEQGGPILSREHISRTIDHSGLWIAYWTDGYTEGDEGRKWMQCHREELVAGLRCFVVSKLGEEVEVPDDLA
jgi:hypothetical protein